MQQLQEELTSTENKVAFARQAFNDSVLELQQRVPELPGQPDREQLRLQAGRVPRDRAAREARGTEGVVQLAASRRATPWTSSRARSRRAARAACSSARSCSRSCSARSRRRLSLAAGCAYSENNSLFLGTESWRPVARRPWRARGSASPSARSALMVLASLYRAASLARGGGHVARMLGATRVTGERQRPAPAAARERRRGDGARVRRAGARDLRARARGRHQCVRGRAARPANAAIASRAARSSASIAPSCKA